MVSKYLQGKEEENQHSKKRPFYDVLIEEPLNEYLDSIAPQKTTPKPSKKLKSDSVEESNSKKTDKVESHPAKEYQGLGFTSASDPPKNSLFRRQ